MPITGIAGKANVRGVLSTSQPLDNQQNRDFFVIQNQGTNALYVKYGTGCTTSDYDVILSACSSAADGTGGVLTDDSYKGPVSIAGTSPSYSIVEF
jgi:hypothetical protein